MIPKKIHYVWFGDKDFGEIEKKCMATWPKILPDYEIVAWTNDCIKKFDNPYFQQAIANKQYAFASDYVRLWALYHEGGIYMTNNTLLRRTMCVYGLYTTKAESIWIPTKKS